MSMGGIGEFFQLRPLVQMAQQHIPGAWNKQGNFGFARELETDYIAQLLAGDQARISTRRQMV